MVTNKNITSLTNGLFEFGVVDGDFECIGCKSLKTLEGGPKETFGYFSCDHCNSLKTLKDAPKEVRGNFYCGDRKIKFTEEDVKKYTTVVKKIYI